MEIWIRKSQRQNETTHTRQIYTAWWNFSGEISLWSSNSSVEGPEWSVHSNHQIGSCFACPSLQIQCYSGFSSKFIVFDPKFFEFSTNTTKIPDRPFPTKNRKRSASLGTFTEADSRFVHFRRAPGTLWQTHPKLSPFTVQIGFIWLSDFRNFHNATWSNFFDTQR